MADSSHSRRLQEYSRIGLVLTAVALTIVVTGAWFASLQSVAALDRAKLDSTQKSLHSYAAETLAVAQQHQRQRSIDTYTKVSFEKLYESVSQLDKDLRLSPAADGLGGRAGQLSRQAGELEDILAKLANLPTGDTLNGQIDNLTKLSHATEEKR